MLRDHYPQSVLLPNLRHLEWFDDEAASCTSMFIQPTLRQFNFQPQATEHMRYVLSAIESHAPEIRESPLIDVVDALEQVRAELSQTVRALHCLRKFRVMHAPLELDAVIHLSRLPRLMWVSLTIDGNNASALDSSARDRFLALQELVALAVTYDGSGTTGRMTHLLDSIASPTLNLLVTNVFYITPLFVSVARFEHLWCYKILFITLPVGEVPLSKFQVFHVRDKCACLDLITYSHACRIFSTYACLYSLFTRLHPVGCCAMHIFLPVQCPLSFPKSVNLTSLHGRRPITSPHIEQHHFLPDHRSTHPAWCATCSEHGQTCAP